MVDRNDTEDNMTSSRLLNVFYNNYTNNISPTQQTGFVAYDTAGDQIVRE